MKLESTVKRTLEFHNAEVVEALYKTFTDRFKGHAPSVDAHLHVYMNHRAGAKVPLTGGGSFQHSAVVMEMSWEEESAD